MAKVRQDFPETQQEADEGSPRQIQKPGQTKKQTQLIAQGIQKGIDEYKKQMKARAREASRQKKLQQARAKQPQQGEQAEKRPRDRRDRGISRQHPLPWVLLVLSWLAFGCAWIWLR